MGSILDKASDFLADQLIGVEDAVDAMLAKGYDKDPVSFMTDVLKIPRNTLVWGENPGYQAHKWDGRPSGRAGLDLLSAD